MDYNAILRKLFKTKFKDISSGARLVSKKIAKKIHSLNLISDIRPDSFASGCILLYCYNKNLNINKKQIANISKISEVTINKCFKKLENNKNDIFT